MKRITLFILLLILAVLGIGFAVLNAEPVPFNYYLGSTEAALSLIVVLALALGALLGVIACLGLIVRQKRHNIRLRRKAALCEQELQNLRQIPIQDKH